MSNLSVSQRLHESLGRLIASTAPGQRLPSEPLLASQLGVSRATLREAMRAFEAQGMIRRRQGSGTYVTRPSAVFESGLEVLESIETLAERIGLKVSAGEWRVEQRAASEEEACALEIPVGASTLRVSRVIMAENGPVAFLIDVLPFDLLTPAELEGSTGGSVLDLLLHRGEPSLLYSRTEITSAPASSDVARSLGIQRGDNLLRFVAYLHDASYRVVDYSYSYFIPGYFRFHVVRRVG